MKVTREGFVKYQLYIMLGNGECFISIHDFYSLCQSANVNFPGLHSLIFKVINNIKL